MFKRSFKSAEPEAQAQDNLSVNSELSKSSDSLTDNNIKDKGAGFKGMFNKKTTKSAKESPLQATLSLKDPELSASNDSLTDNKSSKDKPGVFGGLLKLSHKPGHARRPSQDLLDKELSVSNDSLSDNSNTKESGGMFSGMFKKDKKRTQSREDLSAPSELSDSNDNVSLSGNTKESGGMFSGMFKKDKKRTQSQEDLSAPSELSGSNDDNVSLTGSTKESGGMFSGMFKKDKKRTQSQEDLSAPSELSGSNDDNVSLTGSTKESGGMFSGIFKKSPKPFGARAQSQEDLSAPSELSGSSDNASAAGNTKESGGMFSGMFKKSPKPFGARTQSQDDLSAPGELSASNDNLSENNTKEKGGLLSGVFRKKGAKSQSQNKEKTEPSGGWNEKTSSTEKNKVKQNGLSAMMQSKQEKNLDSDGEEASDSGEGGPSHKQNKLAGAKTKRNPFRSAYKTGSDDEDPPASSDKSSGSKQTPVIGAMSKLNLFRGANKKDTEDAELLKENEKQVEEKSKLEMKRTSADDKVKDKRGAETPVVPVRPSVEEMNRSTRHALIKQRTDHQSHSDDEGLGRDRSAEANEGDEPNPPESKATKVKKHKHHNPFMSRAAAKTKVKKPQRHNPFMPRVKAKVVQRPAQDDAAEEVEDLMEWWNTVEQWEDTPQDEDMTEKEEAKAFALTAEKVQKGIRVFNKLFSERAESLWQHVIDLNGIADSLDKFNKKTKIAQITGGSTSAVGGVATIAGLALAPVTMGVSLIVTAVGLGVATAGGLTSAGAGISNQVNNSMDRKKVEKIVEDYQEKMVDLNKCLKFVKQGIENLRRFDLIKIKKSAYNRDFPALTSSFYEDGAMAGKAILVNANEIMRVVQIANVAGSTAARAVQIASMATGVLTGLFVGMDIYFVAKDSKELKKGAKSEFAAKIRDVATQLHDGLVELNGIREELQSTTTEGGDEDVAALDNDEKVKEYKYDSSDEDEIDRIKKAIKKDIENREYV
ncbi:hypothetical protein F2P81_000286 [Scophthalmus maximus]|uniref:Uncharacterized protein n=1 Tax=Scophthalmus maximus TaxID=52904 RepID=A0A6A4TKR0_SCOMX|nr:hypothetical protein F2P81_000286 [Scophthalmus maximus]